MAEFACMGLYYVAMRKLAKIITKNGQQRVYKIHSDGVK
jgi:hypothetical protein